jgi:hypothetical protein
MAYSYRYGFRLCSLVFSVLSLQYVVLQTGLVASIQVVSPPSRFGYPLTTPHSIAWAETNNVHADNAVTHSLFGEVAAYLRSNAVGAKYGSRASCEPFVIRREGRKGNDSPCPQLIEFGTKQLEAAIANDFLDAGEGSTNDNTGWRMQPVGGNRGGVSFQDSRLSFRHVADAAGTVIFNSAGAYISQTLAASALAALDGLNGVVSGVCLNMYVTRGDAKLSAPPHTDMQDVLVIQTQGRKHWKVYTPPSASELDPFRRGKGEDDMPERLLDSLGSTLLLEVTLEPGDVLFVPARFPHTTDTLSCYKDDEDDHTKPPKIFSEDDWSIHLTVGMDTHVWSMNYLSMRRLGLRRFALQDGLDFDTDKNEEAYTGRANSMLPVELREALFSSVDHNHHNMLSAIVDDGTENTIEKVAMDLYLLNQKVNSAILNRGMQSRGMPIGKKAKISSLSLKQCVAVVTQFRDVGQKLLDAHRDMYTGAIAEQQTRSTEKEGWSARPSGAMSRKQIARLSIFRVPLHFEKMDTIREELRTWADGDDGLGGWAARQSIMQGDQVEEADSSTGTGWLPSSKVINARADGLFDLQQFDGSVKRGVHRRDMKGPHGIGIFI